MQQAEQTKDEPSGDGFAPLVLPVVALVVLRRQAARRVPSAR
jgi:hypothetical protein